LSQEKGAFSQLGNISELFMLCCNCFPYFCGITNSMSKEEIVWPSFVWNLLSSATTVFTLNVIPQLWRGWWIRNVIRDIPVLESVTLNLPKSLVIKRFD
jgi:hypothetical protein